MEREEKREIGRERLKKNTYILNDVLGKTINNNNNNH